METKRLVLRHWEMNDLDDLYAFAKNPNVGPQAGWRQHQSREESRQILSRMVTAPDQFAIMLKSTMKVIGIISAGIDTSRRNLAAKTIGCALNEAYWNQGLGQILLEEGIEWAHSTGVLRKLVLNVQVRNKRAVHLYKKLGFEIEGCQARGACSAEGEFLDVYLMGKLID